MTRINRRTRLRLTVPPSLFSSNVIRREPFEEQATKAVRGPAPVAAIALQNKAVVCDILFKAVAETIRVIGADPKHLGAEIGMVAILHT